MKGVKLCVKTVNLKKKKETIKVHLISKFTSNVLNKETAFLFEVK